jgi:SAM-dependent methyltransferase
VIDKMVYRKNEANPARSDHMLGSVQETQGLLSPMLRDIRLRRIANELKSGTTVLDLGCGAGYLAKFLPADCVYLGIDRLIPPRTERFSDFLRLDLNRPGAIDAVREWLRSRPHYITCAAALEHFVAPFDLIQGFAELIESRGRFVGTTAHPKGQQLHTSLARVGLCSLDGANEHHAFFDRADLERLAVYSGGQLVEYAQFLLGLNQLFIIQY